MQNKFQLNEIQRLRGFACLMVLCQHICLLVPMVYLKGLIPQIMYYGSAGVHIFFVISGFVIMLSLKDKLESCCTTDKFDERLKSASGVLKEFYIKRCFRLIPVFLCTILVMFFFEVFVTGDSVKIIQSLRVFIDTLTGFHNMNMISAGWVEPIHAVGSGPFWTLSVEIQFYIILPIMFLALKSNSIRVKTSLLTGIAFWLCARWTCFAMFHDSMSVYYSTFTNADGLLLGVFLGLMVDKNKLANLEGKQSIFWCILSIVICIMIWVHPNMFMDYHHYVWGNVSVPLAFALVAMAVNKKGILNIPIIKNFLEYLGNRSYSFYLYQMFLSYAINWMINSYYIKLSGDSMFKASMIFLVVLFGLTELSYRFLETPFRKLGDRLAAKYR